MPEAEEGRSCRILSKAKELAACSSQAASPFDDLVSLLPELWESLHIPAKGICILLHNGKVFVDGVNHLRNMLAGLG